MSNYVMWMCLHLQLLKSDLVSFDSWLFIPSDSLCVDLTLVLFSPPAPKSNPFWKRCPVEMAACPAIMCPPSTAHTPTIPLTWVRGSTRLHVSHPAPALSPKQQVSPTHTHTHTHALRAINFYPEIINSVSKYIWGRFILWVKGAVKFIKINKFKGKTFMSIICSGDFRFKETRTMC